MNANAMNNESLLNWTKQREATTDATMSDSAMAPSGAPLIKSYAKPKTNGMTHPNDDERKMAVAMTKATRRFGTMPNKAI